MNKRFAIFYCIIFIFHLMISCHKEVSNTASTEYFPNMVGDYWEYDVYDSSTVRDHPDYPRAYSVSIKITKTQKLVDNNDATVWEYKYPWGTEINYTRLVGDTIKVFDEAYSSTIEYLQYPRLIYILPFQLNERWDGKLLNIDSSRVMTQEIITNSSLSFQSCYNLYHFYSGPNLKFTDNYWFKPKIGMVQIHYNQIMAQAPNIQVWRLKRFNLN